MAYIIFVNPQILADHRHGPERGLRRHLPRRGARLRDHGASTPTGRSPWRPAWASTPSSPSPSSAPWASPGSRRSARCSSPACIFLILTVTGVRRWLVAGIPHSMRSAVAAGIGMFLGIIALKNAGIVVANEATFVGLGHMTEPAPLLAILGFFLIAALDALKVKGSILIGILALTVIAVLTGLTPFGGIMSTPPSIAPTFLQLDVFGALGVGIVQVVLVFVLVEVFDATGTLIGVAKRAGLLNEGPGETSPRARPRADGRLLGDRRRLAARHLLDHRLRRVGLGRAGRRPHRPHRADRRRALPRRAVLRAARRHRPGLRHRAGAALRRLPDDARARRHRLGRHHRVGPGGADRDHDALHLLDRQRPRLRLHQLRADQADDRPRLPGARRHLARRRACS